jgi:hypothetical protein
MKKIILFYFISSLIFVSAKNEIPSNFKKQQTQQVIFLENKGQVSDQNNKPRTDVLYSGTDGKLVYHIKNTGISYQLQKINSWRDKEDPSTKKQIKIPAETIIYRVDINWLNVNTNMEIQKGEQINSYNNYYSDRLSQSIHNVKSYKNIVLKNIYNNIDLMYYEKNGVLKYDYIIAANANYKQIQLEVKGAEIKLLTDGSILLKTPLGEIQEGAPIAYQNKKKLKSNWIITDNKLSFEIENYDPNQELIIDPPTRLWGTFYGGTGNDYGQGCTTDALGNVYMAGYTLSSGGTSIATSGSHQITYGGGGSEAFLVKFNSAGVRQWGTYYGGAGDDVARDCCTDAAGDIYMVAYSNLSTGTVIATSGSHQSILAGGDDVFFVKFNSAGVRQWATYYGGTGNDYGFSCISDISGNIYFAGRTNSGSGIATSLAHQASQGGGTDGFLVKFNASGVRQWGTYYGGGGSELIYTCTSDASGNVFVSGETNASASGIATIGAHQTSNGGGSWDGFFVKFNSAGVRQWGTYYGGSGVDYGISCSADPSGNIYLSGHTSSSSGIATAGSHQPALSGTNNDAYLAKFNTSGVRQWATYYGGSGTEYEGICIVEPTGNVYLEGYSNSTNGIATIGSYQTAPLGSYDCFLVKFNALGARQWGTYYGGFGSEAGAGLALDPSGNVYISGFTPTNGVGISTSSAHQFGNAGGNDGFLVKFDICIPSQPGTISGPVSLCAGVGAQNYSVAAIAGATSYTWTLPGGWIGSSTDNTISITPNTSGTIGIASSNSCGVSSYQTLSVTINPLPNISVTSGAICSGQNYTMVPSGASTYTFSSGTAIVSPTVNTSYSVTGTSAAGCVSALTAVSDITVNATPTITANSGTICSGQSFTLVGSGGVTYSYSSGPVVAPPNSSSYLITGTGANGCTSSAVSIVTVFQNPNLVVTNGAICIGQSFTMSVSGASTYTYSSGSPIVSPTVTTTYSISGTSSVGCVSNTVSNITVNPNPTISVNNGTICSGQSFTLLPNGANTYTYSGGNQVVSPLSNTSYTIIGASSAGCISVSSVTSNVVVNISPTITANTNNTLICAGENATLNVSGANTYTWNPGNSSGASVIVSPGITTNYIVTGTAANGCQDTMSIIQNVSPCLSISEQEFKNDQMSVFPNPTNGYITIDCLVLDQEIEIFNALCQKIQSEKMINQKTEIDFSKEASGIYYIRIGVLVKKIIKE